MRTDKALHMTASLSKEFKKYLGDIASREVLEKAFVQSHWLFLVNGVEFDDTGSLDPDYGDELLELIDTVLWEDV